MSKSIFNSSAIREFRSAAIFIVVTLTVVTIISSIFYHAQLPSYLIISTITFGSIFVSITYLAILEAARYQLIKKLPIKTSDKIEAFFTLSIIPFLFLMLGVISLTSATNVVFELISFDLIIFASITSFYIFLLIIWTFIFTSNKHIKRRKRDKNL